MDKSYTLNFDGAGLAVTGDFLIDAARCCECGQSFRWKERGGGFFGVVRGRGVMVRQLENGIYIEGAQESDVPMWRSYFDLDRDYAAIEAAIAENPNLAACLPYATGIRVFNQEPFEALISFIISANNNIKRISGIVDRLCELSGERASNNGYEYRCFPTPEAIASLTEEQLTGIGTGYRAPFIKRSAQMIMEGYELEPLRYMPLEEARRELRKFPGIGPKVADCVLLFSLGHTDAFPIDVWMNRAMCELFFGGRQPTHAELEQEIKRLGPLSGIVQQYVFHYARAQGIGVK